MKRVVILGSQGAGKSWLARQIGDAHNLPVFHLDDLFWSLRHEKLSRAELDARVLGLASEDAWVIDGHFKRTLAARLAACDTVILLDLPPALCLWRVVKRRFDLMLARTPDDEIGFHQRLTWPLARYIWRFRTDTLPELQEALAQLQQANTVVLDSRRQVQRFVDTTAST